MSSGEKPPMLSMNERSKGLAAVALRTRIIAVFALDVARTRTRLVRTVRRHTPLGVAVD